MANTPYLAGSNSAASGGSTTLTVSLSPGIADGDTIIVGVLVSSAGVTPSVSDSQGNSYTQQQVNTTNATAQLYVFECDGATPLVAGTDTVIVTYSTNASVQGAIVVGDNNVSGADKLVIAAGTSTAPSSGSSGTLTQAEEHAIAFICNANAGGTPTWASPYSAHVLANITGGAVTKLSAAYTTVTATTALTASGTIVSAAWAASELTTLVNPVSVTLSMANGVQNEAYSQTLEASGGNTPYTWSIPVGSLPTGLSIASGVISGTPSVNGTFTFTTRATDANGVTGDMIQTITILPNVVSGAPAINLPLTLLTAADSDFESGSPTWAADTNAGTPAVSTQIALTGLKSLSWSASNDGLTQIATGFYPVVPSQPYISSGFLLPAGVRDCYTGIQWYTSGNTLIRTDYGNDNPSVASSWEPLTFRGTSPSNAAKAKLVFQVANANNGEVTHIDLIDFRGSDVQVLVDWINPTFASGSQAGYDFMDVSPFIRFDAGITMGRGRPDAMSDVNAGSTSFSLQNDQGVFTRRKNAALVTVLGGNVTVQRRYQVACADEFGVWNVRADGPLTDIEYAGDNTGNTNIVSVTGGDVMSFLARQKGLSCWTKQEVLSDMPLYHWTLNDSGNAGGTAIISESSGNNGPTLRVWNSDNTKTATIGFSDTSGGVETLADAVAPLQDDGGGFWSPGSAAPNSKLRGLVSGVTGPFSSAQPNILLTPKLTAQSSFNLYVGNIGYQLNGNLPVLNTTTTDMTFECWFTQDPGIKTNIATKFGPYVPLSLGYSADSSCLVAGIFPTGTSPHSFKVNTYAQPPAFQGKNFTGTGVPATVGTISSNLVADTVALPHHLVITIAAATAGATLTAWLDGVQITGSITLPVNQKFDTICVGGAYGNTGCHWGSVSLVSVYDYALDQGQIQTHTMLGQYGMWEQATDDCVAALAGYSNMPPFWNNIQGKHAGLSLTEYVDISGSTPISAMQTFEAAEDGLLFVASDGRLNFHTRDWRMGHPGPDLNLPPDTFDASMGYGLTDQFLTNEMGVSTQVDSTGAAYINRASVDSYGNYAQNSAQSPLSLPLISWSRAFGQLGLTSFYYFADPNLTDRAAWQANTHAEPWLTPGQLQVDLLTLNKASTGLGISNFYALDIDSLVVPTGTLPASFPDSSGSTQWFIEGVTEFISSNAHTMSFNLSPAEAQRAWLPGDSTYGVLGTTARIGVSQADIGPEQADGKDVSHDAGRPFWPPTFTTRQQLGTNPLFQVAGVASTSGWAGSSATLTTDDGTLYPGGPQPFSCIMTPSGGTAGSALNNGTPFAAAVGDIHSTGAWVYTPVACTVAIGLDYQTSGHVFISSSLQSYASIPANTWTYITNVNLTAPATTGFAYVRVGSSTTNAVVVMTDVRAVRGKNAPADMNNPAQTLKGFVGANDIRGLTDNLNLLITPPMLVVGQTGGAQTFPSGSNSTPQVFWDTVYVDTEGGMGLMPGWPNWYVVTVPGWYDLDAAFVWGTGSANAGTGAAAWLCIAQAGAQGLAAGGSITPVLNGVYVCPIGDQQRMNAASINAVNCPSTRLYLGVGDMITVCADDNITVNRNAGTGVGGPRFSLLYRGLGKADDRVSLNATITGGAVTGKTTTTVFTKSYKNSHTYSYYGDEHSPTDSRRNTDGNCYQGITPSQRSTIGSQSSQMSWPYNTIKSDLTVAGVVKVLSVTLSGKCLNVCDMMLGWSTQTPGASVFNCSAVTNRNAYGVHWSTNESKTITLPSDFATHFMDASPPKMFILGNGTSQDVDKYGWFKGGANAWTLTIQYSVTV